MRTTDLRPVLATIVLTFGLCFEAGAANGSHVWPPKWPLRAKAPVKTAALAVPQRKAEAPTVPAPVQAHPSGMPAVDDQATRRQRTP